MPICENCNHTWSWTQTIKKTTTLMPAMSCPYCGEKLYQTQKSKTKASLFSLIILIPLLIQAIFQVPGIILLSLIPIIGVIIFLLYPFWVELSCKEEYIDLFKK